MKEVTPSKINEKLLKSSDEVTEQFTKDGTFPGSEINTPPIPDVTKKPFDKKIFLKVGIPVGLLLAAGAAVKNCDWIAPPKPEPTPLPLESTLTPTVTQTDSATPTASSTVVAFTATPSPTPTVNPWNTFVFSQGDFRYKLVQAEVRKDFPDIRPDSQLEYGMINLGTIISAAHDGVGIDAACDEPVGQPVSLPGKNILAVGLACFRGEYLPDASEDIKKICSNMMIASGANLDCDNSKKDRAYRAAEEINQLLPTVLKEIQQPK